MVNVILKRSSLWKESIWPTSMNRKWFHRTKRISKITNRQWSLITEEQHGILLQFLKRMKKD